MRIALVFGYGQKPDGSIDEQTKNRCDKAVKLYHRRKIRKIYLTVSATKNGVPMADAMREYLVYQGVDGGDILAHRRGGNTAGEMDVFLSIVPVRSQPVFISTWYHILRIIWLALWRLSAWRIRIGIAWRHVHFKGDVLKEFLKLGNAFLRPRKSSKILPQNPAPP